jgi:probable HAF family extracellular repeat protein
MKKGIHLLLVLGLLSFWPSGPASAEFVGLGDLPGLSFYSEAYDVSGDGLVAVGYSISDSGQEAFRWTEVSGMEGLGSLSGTNFGSYAYGVSEDGAIVVGQSNSGSGVEAFLWTEAGGMVGLSFLPGGSSSSAQGVSADGKVVVGTSRSGGVNQAFRCEWNEATSTCPMVGLGFLPGGSSSHARAASYDGSVIVGAAGSHSGVQAFRWTEASGMVGLGDLDGGDFGSFALGVSADGSVVVGRGTSDSGSEAFRCEWNEATSTCPMVGLGDLPGGNFFSLAWGVSADGSVVVGEGRPDAGREAFIWDATNGMRSLKEALTREFGSSPGNWNLQMATGISADGLTVVGRGFNRSGDPEGWLARLQHRAPVTIDMTPGSPPDSITINLCSRGVVPVAIQGSADLDVNDIVVQTIQVAGSGVAVRGVSRLLYTIRDLNGDGHPDMLVHIEVENLDLCPNG